MGMFAMTSQECSSGFSTGGWNGTPKASANTNIPNTLAMNPPAKIIAPNLSRSGDDLNFQRIMAPRTTRLRPNPRPPIMKPKKRGNVMNRTRVGSISSYFGVDTRLMKNSNGLTGFGFFSLTGVSSDFSGETVSMNARPQHIVSRAVLISSTR